MNKEFLLHVCIRALLLATALVAFLDSQLGYEKTEWKEDAVEAEIFGIGRRVANISKYIHDHA